MIIERNTRISGLRFQKTRTRIMAVQKNENEIKICQQKNERKRELYQ